MEPKPNQLSPLAATRTSQRSLISRGHPTAIAAVVWLMAIGWQPTALAQGRIGQRAPWFRLEHLSGKTFSITELRGRTAVLVVGRTRTSAPQCKRWALEIIGRYGIKLPVFQVIVVDKSWFIPKSFVLSKVKDFTPRQLHSRVLLEWYTAFADAYGIKLHDDPLVFVLGPDGLIKWRYRGPLSKAAFARLSKFLGPKAIKEAGLFETDLRRTCLGAS